MKNLLLLVITITFITNLLPAQSTLAERLGYPADAKLLILHADDLAVSHAENQASFAAIERGSVNSASVMVPCPWLPEVADYARAHPNHDFGLHLTVTSEWLPYKWGPAAVTAEVPSLVNEFGYFYDNCADFGKNAKPAEVERELRAQIEKAKAMGIEPTHLDTHMGCLVFTTPEIFGLYLKMGREYGIPAMISRPMLTQMPAAFQQQVTPADMVVDQVMTAGPADYDKGMADYYETVFRGLQPGVNVLLMHTAFNTEEMKGMCIHHPEWGNEWRQADYDFFVSQRCQRILMEENIQLVSWRELNELYVNRK